MVATFPDPDNAQQTLFVYLKRCSPKSPNIAHDLAPPKVVDPFSRALPLRRSRRRGLLLLSAAAQTVAIALGLWVSMIPQAQMGTASVAPPQDLDALWDALGSDELAQALHLAKEKEIESALSAAEQERLQAQQLRLDAEAQAKGLVDQAADSAREKTVAAVRRADLIAVDATYAGAEQVLFPKAGAEVSLKFAARIRCEEGPFGQTAVAAPLDSRIATREVRNLAVCYPSAETDAGAPIGQAGEWGVPFFKLD